MKDLEDKKFNVTLDISEIDDMLSALGFFCRDYPQDGSKITKRAMEKLEAKLWKTIRTAATKNLKQKGFIK